ncbi:SOS response-associated peptidase [Jiella marina]|uniref:SOS response-associated peptidase n=1 Tax=Jiella sp. LLJ827 TaxID=2917712 RepID=UPI0021019FC1|nr:SOS response-associated peptidase [Jiella sp. LLJ827]MCQ0988387.1 SOS response-associated peptidase [Jiella sp. LLJ827]
MAGRFALTCSPEVLAEHFGLKEIDPFPPRPRILPTQPILVVLAGSEGRVEVWREGRHAQLARWGLTPSWYRGEDTPPVMFAARAETVAEKNAFRGALRHRRCLVPATAFHRKRQAGEGAGKLLEISLAGAQVFAIAGLFEPYMAGDGSEIDTAAILTAPAGPELHGLGERRPVIVDPGDYERWLDCRTNGPDDIGDILDAPIAGRLSFAAADD